MSQGLLENSSISKIPHIPSLNGLRGIAAMLVLWVHFPQIGNSGLSEMVKSLGKTVNAGYLGVDIFFVLSGFLITRILIYEKKTGKLSFKRFYIKRVLRIFPVYYLTLLFCAVFIGSNEDDILWSAVYLSNYYFAFNEIASPLTHTWSLAVEEQFYIFWPLLLFLLPIKHSKFVILIILPIVAIFSTGVTEMVFEKKLAGDLIYRGLQYRMLSLCFGAALAYFEEKVRNVNLLIPLSLVLIGPLLAVASSSAVKVNLIDSAFSLLMLGGTIFSTGVVMFVICIDHKGVALFKNALNSDPLIFLGKISYGLYLYHLVILYLLGYSHFQTQNPVGLAEGILLFSLCIIVSNLSYDYIEQPIMKLKEKINV